MVNFNSNLTRRLDLSYGISYGADLKEPKALLARIAEEEERVLKNPAPVIAVGGTEGEFRTLVASCGAAAATTGTCIIPCRKE